jgi:hypothetical protein
MDVDGAVPKPESSSDDDEKSGKSEKSSSSSSDSDSDSESKSEEKKGGAREEGGFFVELRLRLGQRREEVSVRERVRFEVELVFFQLVLVERVGEVKVEVGFGAEARDARSGQGGGGGGEGGEECPFETEQTVPEVGDVCCFKSGDCGLRRCFFLFGARRLRFFFRLLVSNAFFFARLTLSVPFAFRSQSGRGRVDGQEGVLG